jgi:hypothetical protein
MGNASLAYANPESVGSPPARSPSPAFRISEVDGRATLVWEAGDVDKRLDDVLRQERGEPKRRYQQAGASVRPSPPNVR